MRPGEDKSSAQWRDGVNIANTPLWCDALRARDVCFLSAADAIKPARHGQVIATAETLALMARSQTHQQAAHELAVPVNRPFSIGALRLELFATGHAIGAAGLWVTKDERRIVYAGRVCPAGGGLGGQADARACETLIIAAPYGGDEHRFPAPEAAAAELLAFCQEAMSGGGVAVVLVGTAVKGLDVAAYLGGQGIEVWAARAIHHAARKLAGANLMAPELRRASGAPKGGQTLVWPWTQRERLPALPGGSRVALCSGRAVEDGALAACGADVGVAWSNSAGTDELIAYIDATGAREVYLTGRYNELLAASLESDRRRVTALGPPRQLQLF